MSKDLSAKNILSIYSMEEHGNIFICKIMVEKLSQIIQSHLE